MRIIVLLSVLLVSLSAHASGDCTSFPEQISVLNDIVELVSVAEKVLGVGDVSRIRKIENREFPFVGRFRGPGDLPYSCTGTILDKKFVLGAGHCVDELGEKPLFILSRDPFKTDGAAPTKLVAKGDDWALYELESPIPYNGPYPKLKSVSVEDLRNKSLFSVGYPIDGAGDLTSSFVVDGNCKIFATTFWQRKFLSNCFSRNGMSGGPVGYFEEGVFYIVAVRSGQQWGAFRRVFGQVGTVETPVSFFKDGLEKATERK